MDFDICFLDGRGRLSCVMSARFADFAHASGYAREVMRAPSCRGRFRCAEIHAVGQPADPHLIQSAAAPRVAVKHGVRQARRPLPPGVRALL